MANEVAAAFNDAWRDYVTEGVPSSGPNKPLKSQIRGIGPIVDAQFVLVREEIAAVEADTVAAVEVITDALSERVDDVEAIATAGIIWTTQTIRVRSTANVVLANGLVNAATLNGVTLATGDFVFLGSQTAHAENGIYTVVAAGATSRAAFADSAAELAHIGFVIQEGTDGTGERWTLPLAAADITLGTTALVFAETGIEPGYAAEVEAARGGEATLSDRLDTIDARPSGFEEYGVAIYKSDGIELGGYYAERSVSVDLTLINLFAEIIAGDVGSEVDFYLAVNDSVAYGPATVVLGSPIDITGLSIALSEGDKVSFFVLFVDGAVTEFFVKTFGEMS
ncbi:hypothetical protein [Mesorhizobium ventifaucium]|uniref:Uncharacterized protein n=1 Tax=Mesorhizobium ventifaucium TaxID=666020 RepID=A0ABM9EFF9_9HYPH|nr:hypothetical protein [Mesorhizobium ventifaucium]CAH2408026.1 hypothetical protein MES4922_90022 [Mesorhizobium ventifaucium]